MFARGRETVSAQCLEPFAHGREPVSAQCLERTLVDATEPVRWQCPVSAQCSCLSFDPGRVILITYLPRCRVDANETNGI